MNTKGKKEWQREKRNTVGNKERKKDRQAREKKVERNERKWKKADILVIQRKYGKFVEM